MSSADSGRVLTVYARELRLCFGRAVPEIATGLPSTSSSVCMTGGVWTNYIVTVGADPQDDTSLSCILLYRSEEAVERQLFFDAFIVHGV